MKGQVFTIAKLHYVNGVVYFVAEATKTNLRKVADNYRDTTKSGRAKHPLHRISAIARFAKGLGLVTISKNKDVQITPLGQRYYQERSSNKWGLSKNQKKLLCEHILSIPDRTRTIYAITSLLQLVSSGYTGDGLSRQYSIKIGKEDAWKSEATYKGFTEFGLNYISELGLLEASKVPRIIKPNTFLFTWNPNNWDWDYLPEAVSEANSKGYYREKWSCISHRRIKIGDRAFLMRLGQAPKGIMGSGIVVSDPFEGLHWDPEKAKKGEKVHRVEIVFDVLNDVPVIDEDALATGKLSKFNWLPL